MSDAKSTVAPARPHRAMLPRGAACDLCRSRKVKCDAQKPVCGNCVKAAKGGSVDCVWEGPSSAKIPKKTRLLAAAANAGALPAVLPTPRLLPPPTRTPSLVPSTAHGPSTFHQPILQEVPVLSYPTQASAVPKRDREGEFTEEYHSLDAASSRKRQAGSNPRVDALVDKISASFIHSLAWYYD